MRSWFQDSVLLTSKLGPSLIFSGSSLGRGNGELFMSSSASPQIIWRTQVSQRHSSSVPFTHMQGEYLEVSISESGRSYTL
ncbi:hypothetical protein F2Q69_00049234 [Brassica cretica]|uniref:Uncharacterized protein n=1 Tax=Brassica cretica TaxID=69181 RepID=A0A8S9Q308_BRACR|nr:hypothetical protein F2Q69_00049234 [Brassica cretica]